jgi:hypothetical protein
MILEEKADPKFVSAPANVSQNNVPPPPLTMFPFKFINFSKNVMRGDPDEHRFMQATGESNGHEPLELPISI